MITAHPVSLKINNMKRAIVLTNVFNLLVAIYFLVIAIISLVQLRWYHQLTIAIDTRQFVTSATSYFAFFILLFVAVDLIVIFVLSAIYWTPKTYVGASGRDAIGAPADGADTTLAATTSIHERVSTDQRPQFKRSSSEELARLSPTQHRLVIKSTQTQASGSSVCCSIVLHLIASISLVVVLIIWLLNTGELVREVITTQLDSAFAKYQFTNRSNRFSIAIDAMQDINNCCGSMDYTDFPHKHPSGLSSGHYPGSCCGKNIFGVNARVLCTQDEVIRARQTVGCVNVLSNYYDLVSLLIVPVALVSLFVSITTIAFMTITKGRHSSMESVVTKARHPGVSGARFEHKTVL